MAQEIDNSPSVSGPVFLGQLQIADDGGDRRRRDLIFGFPILFCLAAALGLCLGALTHKQFTGLMWMLLMCLPIVLLARLPNGHKESELMNKQAVSKVDQLLQRTRQGSFGKLPLKKGEIVWLTQEGLYTYHKKFLPWEAFGRFSLEDGMLAEGLKPIHRIILHLKRPRTISQRRAYMSLGLQLLTILIGGTPLLWLIPRLDLRDDVLALSCMTAAALLIFVYVLTRYISETRPERNGLTVLIDQQTPASALLEFLGEYIIV